jgi:CheY-like chemotaxis protein
MSYKSQALPNPGILKDVQILVVDNDADSRYLHKIVFEAHGAQVTTIESIADSMALLEYLIPDILICEIRFFNEDVLTLIERIKTVALDQGKVIPILIVSASCNASFAQNLLAMVEDYLLKPTDINRLVDEVWNLVRLAKATLKPQIFKRLVKHKAGMKHHAPATTHLAASLI